MRRLSFRALIAAVVVAGGSLAVSAPARSLVGADPLSGPLSCSNGASAAAMQRLGTGQGPTGSSPQLGWLSSGGSVFSPAALSGYTIYPADSGGSDAWNSSSFPSYIDSSLANEAYLGTNFIRPTDQFDAADTAWDGTAETNQVWSNMDYLVCQATAAGIYVQLDLSFVCKIIDANFGNPSPEPPCYGTYDGIDLYSTYWKPVIDKIAPHYAGWNTIAYVSFFGDGSGAPADQPATTALVTAYLQVAGEYAGQDSGTDPALLAAGGFTGTNNGYQGGSGAAPWWQQVCNLPSLSMCLVKVYSRNDMNYSPHWFTWASSASKPVVDEEFGMMQCHGDGTFSGDATCPLGAKDPGYGILTDRADFYSWNYSQNAYNGTGFAGWVLWNDSCATGAADYDVSDLAGPAVISVIQQYAVNPPSGSHWISGLNGGNCAPTPALSLADADSLAGAGYAAAGQAVTFTATAVNTGNVTLQGVTVSDPDLAGLTCPASFTGTLAPGAAVSCSGGYAVTQADLDNGSYTNQATATSIQTAPVTATDTITAAQAPALALTTSTPTTGYRAAGDVISYNYRVTNTGNITLTGISITDARVPGASCPDAQLAPGAAETCTGSYTVTAADVKAGKVTDTATATGTTPAGGTVTSTPWSVTAYVIWPAGVTGAYLPPAGAAEGFYLGAAGNTWTLRVTHPGTSKVTFTGTITINKGKFTGVAGVSLGRGNSVMAQSTALTFTITSGGQVNGFRFTAAWPATAITFTLQVNGTPATAGQIYLGGSAAAASTGSPLTFTR